jgi:hypothetical protein
LSLRQLSPEQLQQFAWLGVLPEDVVITQEMAATLWQVSARQASSILRLLWSRALLLPGLTGQRTTYRLHDLMHDLAKRLLMKPTSQEEQLEEFPGLGLTLPEAHQELLNRYRAKTQQEKWHTLPDDGYIHAHLTWHMEMAGWNDAILHLLGEETEQGQNGWYTTLSHLEQTKVFVQDFTRAWRKAEEYPYHLNNRESEPIKILKGVALKVLDAFLFIKDESKSDNFSSSKEGYLLEILHLPEIAHEALRAIQGIRSEADRAKVLRNLIPQLPYTLLQDALEVAQQIQNNFIRISLLNNFSSFLREDLLVAIAEVNQTIQYEIQMFAPTHPVLVGSEVEIRFNLTTQSETGKSQEYLLEIPYIDSLGGELNVLFTGENSQFHKNNSVTIPTSLSTNDSDSWQISSQTVPLYLTVLKPGSIVIRAEIYFKENFKTVLETFIQVILLEEIVVIPPNAARSRPVPQPDLILQIQTIWNENLSTCTFRYHLDSFHPRLPFASDIQQQSETLSVGWLEQARSLLQTTLEEAANSLSEDFRVRLTSLGQHLFQQLLPPELQTTFRSVMRFNQPFTLLILADQDAGLPWELLHDGQGFWGERFIIGRWSWELERTRPYEFEIGAVNVAHYADVEHLNQWASLLEPPGAPPPMLLSGGVLADLGVLDAMRGLHLLRRGKSFDEVDRQDAPVPFDRNGAADLEQELQPAKLSLRRNRPLVTLGYVNAGLAELTMLEQTWAPTFIRSGSAFVGTLWAVQPAVEAAFISSFYHRLWTGDSLGIAFQAGRRAARSLVPDSLDCMAYTLFGDPMARPYRPTEGKGYAVVEPIGQEITDAVAPGASVRFRVSLRRTPPVWYTNRLMDVAEDLAFNDLQIYIAASGLQVTPAESIGMQRTPTGDYLGWFTLTVPSTFAGDSALVQVHFEDGIEPIHSLRFSLTVGNPEGEPQ